MTPTLPSPPGRAEAIPRSTAVASSLQDLDSMESRATSCLEDSAPAAAQFSHAGRGHLHVAMVAGRSVAVSTAASNPLKILVPRSRGTSVWAYLSSFGGGLVAGDQITLDIRLEAGCRCFVGTQASTKVYRNPRALPCGQRLKAVLGPGALLVLAPDPVQPYAGASYIQRQEIHLATGSSLVLVDGVSSGRMARGERWEFRRYASRLDVFRGTERIFLDSLLLDSVHGPLDGSHRLDGFNGLALLSLTGDAVRAAALRLADEVAAQPVVRGASTVWSASRVADGVVLRVAGERTEDVYAAVCQRLAFVSELLGDNPWSRKW